MGSRCVKEGKRVFPPLILVRWALLCALKNIKEILTVDLQKRVQQSVMGNGSYTSVGAGGVRKLHPSVFPPLPFSFLFPPFHLPEHAEKFSPLSVAV